MNKTIITQIIPTIQGEGPSVGTVILLIRLANCNLDCVWCDTKWSNNIKLKEIKKFTSNNKQLPFIIDDTNFSTFTDYLNDHFLKMNSINTILLTGGEPLINKEFVRRIIFNTSLRNISKIEIETNGVLLDNKEDDDWKIFDAWERIIQINISPKLDPSYYRSNKIKTVENIIKLFNENYDKSIKAILEKTPVSINWKFVYSKAGEESINKFIRNVTNINNVYIMPLTPDYTKYKSETKFLEDYRKSCYDAIDYCLRTGHVFAGRLHIFIFNNFLHRDEFVDVMKK